MKTKAIILIFSILAPFILKAQQNDAAKQWSLSDCIEYAKEKNISIKKSEISQQQNQYSLEQSKANMLPTLSGSASTTFSWDKETLTENNSFANRSRSNNTSFSLNAGMTLFNGHKIKKQISQAEANLKSSEYGTQAQEEEIELSILNAYLEILYAKENIKNTKQQIEATQEEMALAKERMDIGVISKSDYLQIKAELASENSTLADYESTLTVNKITLMQLMEMQVAEGFDIVDPNIEGQLLDIEKEGASEVYKQALETKAIVKQAALTVESSKYDIGIAKAGYYPSVSLSAGVSSGWSDQISGYSYSEQLTNQFTPNVGLSVSIPIFQNKEAKINVAQAKLSVADAKLDEIDTKNNLRKEIEQACADLSSAKVQYGASLDQYESANESYDVAVEQYNEGLINSVDFLSIKTDKIKAESSLLQAKYNLIFSNKIVDYYKGETLKF